MWIFTLLKLYNLIRGVYIMFNFNNDYDLIPRTYSIKSYRKRESLLEGRFLKSFVYIVFLLFIAALVFIFLIN